MRFTLPKLLPGFVPSQAPPPELPAYGISDLALFRRFNRSEFLSYTGVQAPLHRSEDEMPEVAAELDIPEEQAELHTRIKRWADLSVAPLPGRDPYQIRYVEAVGGEPVWKTLMITNELACSINLPGRYDYPRWKPAPSGVTVAGPVGPTGTVSEEYLATEEQAKSLASVLGGTHREDVFTGGIFAYQFANDEVRRVWWVDLGGDRTYNAGHLLKEQYKAGVDAPGHWDAEDKSRAPMWIPELDPDVGEHDLRPEIPIPMRSLYPTEKFQTSGFGGLLQIANLNLVEETQIDVLRRIDRNVKLIQKELAA